MTSVSLGMPSAPPPVLAPRRKSRQIKVGKVMVGGDAPVSVQSMCTTLPADVNTTRQQIAERPAAVGMVRAYELLAEAGDWPLHLGVTEAGPAFQGTIKSSVAFGALLSRGIGDTIRVSLSAPPVEEVKVGIQILQSLNLRPRKLEIVSCPSCGRAQVDVYTLADEVTAGLEGMEVPLRVAVMGCVVNGPGEAREADLGVASGNGKGQIFVKGEVVKTVPEAQIVETLIEEAMRIAEGMEEVEGGSPSVSVS